MKHFFNFIFAVAVMGVMTPAAATSWTDEEEIYTSHTSTTQSFQSSDPSTIDNINPICAGEGTCRNVRNATTCVLFVGSALIIGGMAGYYLIPATQENMVTTVLDGASKISYQQCEQILTTCAQQVYEVPAILQLVKDTGIRAASDLFTSCTENLPEVCTTVPATIEFCLSNVNGAMNYLSQASSVVDPEHGIVNIGFITHCQQIVSNSSWSCVESLRLESLGTSFAPDSSLINHIETFCNTTQAAIGNFLFSLSASIVS